MKQVIELLGKTVKFVHTENGQELYLLSDLLELEIV